MQHPDALRWDSRYSGEADWYSLRSPRHLVTSHLNLLPPNGLILDMAGGTTSTGRYLAAHGWRVVVLDVSLVALQLARQRSIKKSLPISFAVLDLMNPWLPASHFDVILNFYFLSRPLWDTYRNALKPGGLLFFETYLSEPGPNSTHYLNTQELRLAFDDWQIFHYLEVERLAPSRNGGHRTRWSAQLVARKPE
jgi:tellurite methyltransferase